MPEEKTRLSVRCVLVGDRAVGKTCLLISYTNDRFPEDYVATVFENYVATVVVDRVPINFCLWDTSGQDEFAHMRILSYPRTGVFIVTFSVVDRVSFESVRTRWLPELKAHGPEAPLILVGTQLDLRHCQVTNERLRTQRQTPVSFEEGLELSAQIGASRYLECSALTQQGIKTVFDEAIRFVVLPPNSRRTSTSKTCSVM
tara:strand:- start:2317 stop:2919 length:603 start_codon:yes stop_codon:yes gene_type:complete